MNIHLEQLKGNFYYDTAVAIIDKFTNELKQFHSLRFVPNKWELGMITKVEYLLRNGIELIDIQNCIFNAIPDIVNNGKFVKPSQILERLNPTVSYRRILIDNAGNERDKQIWGYFNVGGDYSPPTNSELFNTLKEEEENRILYNKRKEIYDKYFQAGGFLRPEYSFISGIFNEFNSQWVKNVTTN